MDVILLPGLLCDSRLWAAQIEALAGVARCVVPDLTSDRTIAAMADGVLRQAPDRFALVGFSLGGCVALEIVGRAPERVSRLALLSTVAHGILTPVREHYLRSIAAIESGGLAAYLTDAFPRYVAPGSAHNQDLRATFVAMGEAFGPAVAVRQMRALLEYAGFSGDLRQIGCPTVVVAGREDERILPKVQMALADEIPGATFRVIDRAGHFTPLEAPDEVTDIFRSWLTSHHAD